MKLWEKGTPLNKQIEAYTVGNDTILDQALIKCDCLASIAHAKMLAKIDILTDDEAAALENELHNIIELDTKGKFTIRPEQEDCHTAIEAYLVGKLGDTGKKIHTARSRNDQVLTALRLYYKTQLADTKDLATEFGKIVEAFAKKHENIIFPGYTHTRKAMPSSVAMWANAFVDAMQDNQPLLNAAYNLIDQSPLGTAAGYGVPLELDREFTKTELGFSRIQHNPIYTQLSRGKFESSILHALSQIMIDLNRLTSDLILFSLPDFGYFELPAELCTGSSIMPQKKNPDVLELLRANYHVINSLEMQLKTIPANLISGYHRDLQLTKEPVMRTFEITNSSLSIINLVIEKLQVNEANCATAMTDELYATQKVYELVEKGMPFRDAYKKVAGDIE